MSVKHAFVSETAQKNREHLRISGPWGALNDTDAQTIIWKMCFADEIKHLTWTPTQAKTWNVHYFCFAFAVTLATDQYRSRTIPNWIYK